VTESANTILGRNVRRLRKEQELTQEDLAHLAGLHAPAVGRLERAVVDSRLSTVQKLADALEVSISELLRTR
jgi:transcriptional regulator with XRE-family HTH domain